MLPGSYPLEIVVGEDFARRFVWRAGPTEAQLEPVNLAGWTAEAAFSVRGVVVQRLTSDVDGGIVLGAEPGTIDVAITSAQSGAFSRGQGDWSLVVVSPTGKRDPLIAGELTILKVAG